MNSDGKTTRAIEPVPEDGNRPFWSVMIPVHGCGPQLEETLQSVREQDPGPSRGQIRRRNRLGDRRDGHGHDSLTGGASEQRIGSRLPAGSEELTECETNSASWIGGHSGQGGSDLSHALAGPRG